MFVSEHENTYLMGRTQSMLFSVVTYDSKIALKRHFKIPSCNVIFTNFQLNNALYIFKGVFV